MKNVKVYYMPNSNDSFVREIDADKAIREEKRKNYQDGFLKGIDCLYSKIEFRLQTEETIDRQFLDRIVEYMTEDIGDIEY